jgi:NADH-quinone oxidoreductase subunit J
MHLILFFLFAGFCLAGAINLLLQTHPINSALSLIVVMTSLAVLYLLLGAEFLAIAQIIVYAGAVMVLFTSSSCCSMPAAKSAPSAAAPPRASAFPAVAVLFAVLATIILHAQGLGAAHLGEGLSNAPGQSNLSFSARCSSTNCCCPFEVTSVLILIAILGAVALAHVEGSKIPESERVAEK